jgi:hypothetical protein
MELERVTELLKIKPAVVESGTTAVDDDLFIPLVGEIDMVGVSRGRLILACVFDELQSRHLKQLPDIHRWAQENSKLLEHAYRAKGLSKGFSICIWYLCRAVGSDAELLLPALSDFPLNIYRYRTVKSKGRESLAVEQLAVKPQTDVIKIPTNINFELNEQEMGEFLKTDDEITYTGPDLNS